MESRFWVQVWLGSRVGVQGWFGVEDLVVVQVWSPGLVGLQVWLGSKGGGTKNKRRRRKGRKRKNGGEEETSDTNHTGPQTNQDAKPAETVRFWT